MCKVEISLWKIIQCHILVPLFWGGEVAEAGILLAPNILPVVDLPSIARRVTFLVHGGTCIAASLLLFTTVIWGHLEGLGSVSGASNWMSTENIQELRCLLEICTASCELGTGRSFSPASEETPPC